MDMLWMFASDYCRNVGVVMDAIINDGVGMT